MVLAAAVVTENRARQISDEVRGYFAELVTRQVQSEVWLGRGVPAPIASMGGDLRSPVLFWLVDVDACADCLSDIENLNLYASTGSTVAVVVSAANPDDAAHFADRLGNVQHVEAVQAGFIEEAFGFPFPSLRFVSKDGKIVSVDSRLPDSTCRWSYAAHIAALTGGSADLPLRPRRVDP